MQDPRSIERLRRGDGSTLKRLFKANYAKLFPLALRLTRDEAATREMIRASFKQLWDERKELGRFEVIGLRLLRHTFEQSMEFRRVHVITGVEFHSRMGDDGDVEAILSDIGERERLIYLLHLVDGYSTRELAKAFDVEEEEILEAVGQALMALDERLENRDQPSTQPPTAGASSTLWP